MTGVVDWLMAGAPSAAQPDQLMAELCDRLVGSGVPLWRAAIFVRTLHPQLLGRAFHWRQGSGVTVDEAPHELAETQAFRESPVVHVFATGAGLRRRLGEADCPIDFPFLATLRGDGATDYLITPLVFSDGRIHVATWATRQEGGFSASEIAALEAIAAPLARVVEIRALRRTASNLLDTYVGHQAGERILAGHIRRGDIEAIDAAIWLSDMRGFTALADRLSGESLIDLLNGYFECQVPAIVDEGGEVLKFVGDGLLAIFPIEGGEAGLAAVCGRALAAARRAQREVAALGTPDAAVGRVRFGLALHLGNVLYGNVGGGNRLDFTCIGPAVNLAARMEKLTRELGRTIVASSAFARHCPAQLVPIGEFRLAGFRQSELLFGLAEEAEDESPVERSEE